jgi:hypothetical protein
VDLNDGFLDTNILRYYDQCTKLCQDWFGKVRDPLWPTRLFPNEFTALLRVPIFRCYWAFLRHSRNDIGTFVRQICFVAVRRVEGGHTDIIRERWVRDLLTERAVIRLMHDQCTTQFCSGSAFAASNLIGQLWHGVDIQSAESDVASTIQARSKLLGSIRVPDEEYVAVLWVVGDYLEHVVGWGGLCSLYKARTFASWKDELPHAQRELVERFLRL